MRSRKVRVGLVGYGIGGRLFHAPYIAASASCALVGIVTSSPERRAQAEAETGKPTFATLEAMLAAEVDLVVLSTPLSGRALLAEHVLRSGVHVVVDKPFATDVSEAERLIALARDSGLLLNVFHNRRRDADIVTALAVIHAGHLGEVERLDLRCDQDEPALFEDGHAGGVLWDLGSHLVDQAVQLLGPVTQVHARLTRQGDAKPVTSFNLGLYHEDGAYSQLSSTKLARLHSRELRLIGNLGSYSSDYRDVQYEAVAAGRLPSDRPSRWGVEHPERWGVLRTTSEDRKVESLAGNYTGFYDDLAEALLHGGDGPVPAVDALQVLEVLEVAVEADRTRSIRSVPQLTGQ